MPFHGIPSKVLDRAPTRAPRRSEAAPAQTGPETAPVNHEFPAAYDWAEAFPPPKPRELPPALASLVEAACAAMGCPPEQIKAMRERALDAPEAVERFCVEVHASRGNGPRSDPLLAARADGSVAFWIEGLAGKAIFRAAPTEALRPYDGQTLALSETPRSPFPNYSPKRFAAAKLLHRQSARSELPHTPISTSETLPWEDAASPTEAAPPTSAAAPSQVDVEPGAPVGSLAGCASDSDDDHWGLRD